MVVGTGVVAIFDRPVEPSFKRRNLSAWVGDIHPAMFTRNVAMRMTRVAGTKTIVTRSGQIFVVGGPVTNLSMVGFGASGPTFGYPREHYAAGAAIREIGTNAIPHLLRTIYSQDGKLKSTCAALWRKQTVVKWPIELAEDQRARALPALKELGPLAVWAWVEILTNRLSNFEVQSYAAQSLLELGKDATPVAPALMMLENHTNFAIGLWMRQTVQKCDLDGVLTSLHNLRYSPDANTRAAGAWSLGYVAKHPDMSLPALTRALKDPSRQVRESAVAAIGKFGTNAISLTNFIAGAMNDPELKVRSAATNALEQLSRELGR